MNDTFRPCQIVCLEYENSRLYAEVVQTVEGRQVCWVRPLVLTVASSSDRTNNDELQATHVNDESALLQYYDLRHGADLLWPLTFFRAALDVEVLPLLSYLYPDRENSKPDPTGSSQLRTFVQRLWQAYPDAF